MEIKPSEKKIELTNEFVYFRIDEDGIFARDNTDIYNEQSLFTQSKRNVNKASGELVRGFCPTTTFQTIINHISAYNIRCHSYCAVD